MKYCGVGGYSALPARRIIREKEEGHRLEVCRSPPLNASSGNPLTHSQTPRSSRPRRWPSRTPERSCGRWWTWASSGSSAPPRSRRTCRTTRGCRRWCTDYWVGEGHWRMVHGTGRGPARRGKSLPRAEAAIRGTCPGRGLHEENERDWAEETHRR